MGGMGTFGDKITSTMNKVPGHKLVNSVLKKAGLPTDHDLLDTPDTPAAAETTVIPTEDTEAVTAAKRRRTADQMARSGRQSTILSDRLGG